ncbi:hypothetical protein TGRUB_266820 [Toxoplasma gondii RUB]|uniref:Uncharacterized protein n=1 Tax=Toxoplasma gondii RUB TaxID=935652 RepID=A0A086LQF1_TOXGO|nr:hypothetical protein TGRUB_266820 [Toxoplasma gondii RUB]
MDSDTTAPYKSVGLKSAHFPLAVSLREERVYFPVSIVANGLRLTGSKFVVEKSRDAGKCTSSNDCILARGCLIRAFFCTVYVGKDLFLHLPVSLASGLHSCPTTRGLGAPISKPFSESLSVSATLLFRRHFGVDAYGPPSLVLVPKTK